MKVVLAVPCFDHVYTDFAFSLGRLLARLPKDFQVDVADIRGTDIVGARNVAAETTLLNKHDYLFFLDSDMDFPMDTLTRLLSHGKPVVGATYVRRKAPYEYLGKFQQGFKVGGLIEAEELPTGCLLINSAVLRKLTYPWFKFEWGEKQGDRLGEDQYFCREVRKSGTPIWCDTKLSQELSHIGIKKYKSEEKKDV